MCRTCDMKFAETTPARHFGGNLLALPPKLPYISWPRNLPTWRMSNAETDDTWFALAGAGVLRRPRLVRRWRRIATRRGGRTGGFPRQPGRLLRAGLHARSLL